VHGPASRTGAIILKHLSSEVVAIALTALLSVTVVASARRMLGAPHMVEPDLVSPDG